MTTPATPLSLEVITPASARIAAITVHERSRAAQRWTATLTDVAEAAGLRADFEYRHANSDNAELVAAVLDAAGTHDHSPHNEPLRAEGRCVRIGLRSDTPHAGRQHDVVLPYPNELVAVACEHLGIDPPLRTSEPSPAPAMIEPAAAHIAALQQAASDLLRQAPPLHFEDLSHAAGYLIADALDAVRDAHPQAGITVVRSPAPASTQPLRLLITLPPERCDGCGPDCRGHAADDTHTWRCRTCSEPAALRHLASLTITADDPDPEHPRGLSVTGPAALTALTRLGAAAHQAIQDTHAAADAWDLAFEIAEEFEHRAASDPTHHAAELLASWVNDAYTYQDLRTDYADAGCSDLQALRPYQPLVLWSPDRRELWIGHAGPPHRAGTQRPPIVAVLDADSVANATSAGTVALSAAHQLRSQLPHGHTAALAPLPAVHDNGPSGSLHTLIAEPDASRLDGPCTPAAGAALGIVADLARPGRTRWAPADPAEPPEPHQTLASI